VQTGQDLVDFAEISHGSKVKVTSQRGKQSIGQVKEFNIEYVVASARKGLGMGHARVSIE